MRDVVVIGSEGQLGQCVRLMGEQWTFLDSDDLDLRDPKNVHMYFSTEKPKVILNLAAFTEVEKAEHNESLAIAINAESSAALAENCEHYVYISSAYVFDGKSKTAYSEEHSTNPINGYGKSKDLGEKAALSANSNSFIVRTCWLYSEFGNNFLKNILNSAQEKEELSVAKDQVGSPTYARDLAEALVLLVHEIHEHPPGIYHFVNDGQCSEFEFAKEALSLSSLDIKMIPTTGDTKSPDVQKPRWSVLDNLKIQKEFKINIPSWQNALQRCLAELEITQLP